MLSKQFNVIFYKNTISSTAIASLLRQLATLLAAGVSILSACTLLQTHNHHTSLHRLIQCIKQDILSGQSLHYALRQYPLYFDPLTLQLIYIGEQTGKLDLSLQAIAQHHENKLALQRKIKQSLFYPCVISFIACGISVCMLLFIIPRFAELFAGKENNLPFITRFIFLLATTLQQHGIWLLMIPLMIACLYYFYGPHNTQSVYQYLFSLPFIKQLHLTVQVARFTRHLALMLSAGMTITDALRTSIHTTQPSPFFIVLQQVHATICAGTPLHRALGLHAAFPASLIQMSKIGEESGMLDDMLARAADLLEAEMDLIIGRLTQLLEPLIMLILGALIGGAVISLYLPIFKLGSAF